MEKTVDRSRLRWSPIGLIDIGEGTDREVDVLADAADDTAAAIAASTADRYEC